MDAGLSPRLPRSRRQGGVTLIELLVTLSIATLVLTLGIGGLTQLVAQNRRASDVNTLAGNLNYARAEAVYRATDIVVCPIDPANLPDEPSNPCATVLADDEDRQWSQGYAILVEDTGERLRMQPATAGVTIETSNVNQFRFRDDGSGTNATIRVCDKRDDAASDAARAEGIVPPRAVVVSPVGRVRVADSMPDGSDIDCSNGQPDPSGGS
jgi:type IV fimbrial biogenesis protein FimT